MPPCRCLESPDLYKLLIPHPFLLPVVRLKLPLPFHAHGMLLSSHPHCQLDSWTRPCTCHALLIPSLRTNVSRTYNSIFHQHGQLGEWSLYPLKTPEWGHITAFVSISILIRAQPLCWLEPQRSIWTITRSCPEDWAANLLVYSWVVLCHTLRAW